MKIQFISPLFLLILLICSCSTDLCEDVDCGPGDCVEGVCDCPDGFSGENCEIQDLCFQVDCQNAICNPATGDCDCNENYYGENCEDLCVNGNYVNGTCECLDGYEGDSCEQEIRDIFIGRWEAINWTYAFDIGGSPSDGALPAFINFEKGDDIFDVLLATEDFALRISDENRVEGQITLTSITFELQPLITQNPDGTIYGSATLDNNELRISLYPYSSITEEVIGIFTKI